LNFNILQGQARLTSRIVWRDALSFKGQLEGSEWRLHALKGWPIDTTATSNIVADIEAAQVAGAFHWQLNQAALNGFLGDSPLSAKVKASGEAHDIAIETLVVRHLENSVEVTGNITGNQAKLKLRTAAPNLSPYSPMLQGDISLEGDITTSLDHWQDTLNLNLSATSKSLTLGDAHIADTEMSLKNQGRQLNGQWHSHFIHSGELALEHVQHTLSGQLTDSGIHITGSGNSGMLLNGQRLNLPTLTSQWQWHKGGDTLLDGQINASDDRVNIDIVSRLDRQQRLDVQGDIALLHLNWLTQYQPRLARIDGHAQLHLEATGSLASSEPLKVSGRFTAAAPQTQLIDPDILLNDILIQGELAGDGGFTFSGQALQAERPIQLGGQGRLTGPALSFTIDAEQLHAQTPAVDIRLSPSLAIDWQPQQLTVRGKLDIPSADISFSQLPNPSFSHSSDVVVLGRDSQAPKNTLAQDISVRLHLDENVLVKAAGLATKLRGDLLYTSLSGKPVQLQGKLDLLDGRLASQSGDLSIKRGSLIFSGKPDNPAVDIIAARQIDTPAIEVGLHLTGSLQDLRTAVVSFPAMDQSRALSYLVFGRDITQEDDGSGSANAQLMSAAISLGIGQSSRLMQSLKRGTGLDELAAVANDSGSASLIAGKQINSKLYARYRYDMAEALGVLLLRYKLSQRWTLEAESGVDNSIDILFRLGD
jgi:autotransporter translocation and assembly factor TamB